MTSAVGLRVAILQPPATGGDAEAALRHTEDTLNAVASLGCQMLVAPEMYLPGYNQPDAIRSQAQGRDGDWITRLRKICAAAGCGLTIGFAEREGDAIFNSACAIDARGKVLDFYRKVQLFGAREKALYEPGTRYSVFEFNGIRCAMLICYDAEFEYHWNALRARGVQVIFTPSANMQPYENVSEIILPAHAATTNLTMCYANYAEREGDLDYCGLSIVTGVGGRVLAKAGAVPGVIFADIPLHDQQKDPLWATQSDDLITL